MEYVIIKLFAFHSRLAYEFVFKKEFRSLAFLTKTTGVNEMSFGILNAGDVYERMARDTFESVR